MLMQKECLEIPLETSISVTVHGKTEGVLDIYLVDSIDIIYMVREKVFL